MLHSLLFDRLKTAAGSQAAWTVYCRLEMCCAHGSASCSLRKDGFLGALAILGFCNVDGLDDGGAFIGSPFADAALEVGSGDLSWSCRWLWLVCPCLPLCKPSVSTIDSLKFTNHAHHVKMDLLSFIHDLILKAIIPHSEGICFELELLEVALEGCKILK